LRKHLQVLDNYLSTVKISLIRSAVRQAIITLAFFVHYNTIRINFIILGHTSDSSKSTRMHAGRRTSPIIIRVCIDISLYRSTIGRRSRTVFESLAVETPRAENNNNNIRYYDDKSRFVNGGGCERPRDNICYTRSIIYDLQTILYERDEFLVNGNFHEIRRR